MAFEEPFGALRYVVETKPRGVRRAFEVVAVLADMGDAVYVADARFSSDGEAVRVLDVTDHEYVYVAGTRWPPKANTPTRTP